MTLRVILRRSTLVISRPLTLRTLAFLPLTTIVAVTTGSLRRRTWIVKKRREPQPFAPMVSGSAPPTGVGVGVAVAVGVGVGVGLMITLELTLVLVVAVWSAGVGSVGGPVTVALATAVPTVLSFATTLITLDSPAASGGSSQVTPPLVEQEAEAREAETTVAPSGAVNATERPLTVEGPAFGTVTVYVTLSPCSTGSGVSVIEIE